MKLLDEDRFKHVDIHHTDLRKTFKRIRDKMKADAQKREQAPTVVIPLLRKEAK